MLFILLALKMGMFPGEIHIVFPRITSINGAELPNQIILSEVGGILCKGFYLLFFFFSSFPPLLFLAVMGSLTCTGLLDTWYMLFVAVFVCKAHTDTFND